MAIDCVLCTCVLIVCMLCFMCVSIDSFWFAIACECFCLTCVSVEYDDCD